MITKEALKQVRLLYRLNSRVKSYFTKIALRFLSWRYRRAASRIGFVYDRDEAIRHFRKRHKYYRPNFTAAAAGDLRVFWIGTNKAQDDSGFLQALGRLARVTAFRNANGGYGVWSGEGSSTLWDIRASNDKELLSQLSELHEREGVDLLLGQMWAGRISKETLIRVQMMGIPVVNIAMDDRLPTHWRRYKGVLMGSIGLFPGIDLVLTTAPETCSWYGTAGCPAIYWPLASDPELFSPGIEGARDIDVLFIGNRYGVRGEIVENLGRLGINVSCYGDGWLNGYVNADESAALYRRARIVLGVGTVGHCHDVYTLKLRDFDAVMSSALYLTSRNPDLCALFDEGREIECYKDSAEAARKIHYYLEQSSERIRIGAAGRAKALSLHSWEFRLTSTFREIGLLNDKNE